MTAPFFSNNPNDWIALEGLYISEQVPPATISGVNLNGVAIVGETIRGPVGVAVPVGSEARFLAVFGGRDQGSGGSITNKVWLSLLNKRFGTVFVVRAAAAAAVKATHTFANVTPTNIIRVDASSVGSWGNNVTAAVEDASDGDSNHFNLRVTYLGGETVYKNINTNSTSDNTLEVLGDDYANLITVTKLNNGRPLNASAALTTGADGTIADSDFTGSGGPIEVASNVKGAGCVLVAQRSNSNIKTKLYAMAQASNDRMFLLCPDSETTSSATAITEVASYRDDRVVYCFNHAYTLDSTTNTKVITPPVDWMASIFSQIDVDVNPGEQDTKPLLALIAGLYNEAYSRSDYVAFKAAGIAAMEHDGDDGFAFVSGVTSSLTSGLEQITRRRSADFLQLSPAKELNKVVKKKNTQARRDAVLGLLNAFLGDLKKAERIVKDFQVLFDSAPVNQVRIRMRVQLIDHILSLVLITEIGDTVEIKAVS